MTDVRFAARRPLFGEPCMLITPFPPWQPVPGAPVPAQVRPLFLCFVFELFQYAAICVPATFRPAPRVLPSENGESGLASVTAPEALWQPRQKGSRLDGVAD